MELIVARLERVSLDYGREVLICSLSCLSDILNDQIFDDSVSKLIENALVEHRG